MPTPKMVPFLMPLVLCGCAQGFDRNALQERLNDGTLQSPDAAIAETRGLKPQLRFPCRIAVYLKPGDRDWRWTPEDKAVMEQVAATLKQEGVASEMFLLPEMLAGKGDVKELRLAAAKCGADVLYVVHGAAQTDSYKNFAAVLNITVVGGYVVPASHKDTLFLIEGVLLDVDNGYVYGAAWGEGVGKLMRPTFVIEETKAVDAFGWATLLRLRTLAGKPAAVSDVPAVRPTTGEPVNAGGVMTGITAPRPNP